MGVIHKPGLFIILKRARIDKKILKGDSSNEMHITVDVKIWKYLEHLTSESILCVRFYSPEFRNNFE